MTRCLLVLALLFGQILQASANPFPRPAELEPDVRFWVRVYTEVNTTGGYVHDARNLAVVYETLQFPEGLNSAEQTRRINASRERYQRALQELASGRKSGLSADAEHVRRLWPKGTPPQRFRQAADDVRFQRGQANRFREGLARSGRWREHILATLDQHGLPRELVVLPHVESSFNPTAYSHAAAAGMWQFMPATGREFMQVNHIIDERLDPYFSTEAAARLLKRNFHTTGTWPLAVTGYNHGANGVRRAVQAQGTTDIATIVRNYQGPAFGFASRNFYVSFLAALEVDQHPERYFGKVDYARPENYDIFQAPAYVPAATLAQALGVDAATLRQYNPALRAPVWSGEKYIPQGYTLRVPRTVLRAPAQQLVASIPTSQRFASQNPDRYHRVAPGESLSVIARRHNTSVRELMALNGLDSEHRIRAGAQLRLPGAAPAAAGTRVASTGVGAGAGASAVAGGGGNAVHRVQAGESLWTIASRHGTTVAALRAANNLGNDSKILAGQSLRIPGAVVGSTGPYVVQRGDSLWSIASRHGTSVRALSDLNGLDGRTLQPGQRLQLPARAAVQTAHAEEAGCMPVTC